VRNVRKPVEKAHDGCPMMVIVPDILEYQSEVHDWAQKNLPRIMGKGYLTRAGVATGEAPIPCDNQPRNPKNGNKILRNVRYGTRRQEGGGGNEKGNSATTKTKPVTIVCEASSMA